MLNAKGYIGIPRKAGGAINANNGTRKNKVPLDKLKDDSYSSPLV